MVQVIIANEFIGAVIGPGGKVIQQMQKDTDTVISVTEDENENGVVEIQGINQEKIDKAIAMIDSITFKPEINATYKVKVIKVLDFGPVVEYLDAPGNEVLVHISELAWERTEKVTDVVNVGDEFEIKYFGKDPRTKKDKVSRKALLEKPEGYVERAPRPPRDNNRGRDNRNRDRR